MNQSDIWNILITDDDPTNRDILTSAIKEIFPEINIAYACNGEQAVDVVKMKIEKDAGNFNVIFMDYQMPLLNGQEATRAIRTHEKTANLQEGKTAYIVTWSAARNKPFDGADSIIAKPLINDELSTVFEGLAQCKN